MIKGYGLVFAVIVSACLLLFGSGARADDSQPGYLEFSEISDGRFSVLWRIPKAANAQTPLALILPDTVQNLTAPTTTAMSRTIVERRLIQVAPNSFAGSRIEVDGLLETNTDVLVRVAFSNGVATTTLLQPSQNWMIVQGPRSAAQITWDYTVLGFEHILEGFDHLLFVLALLLIVGPSRRLFWAITAFTGAHSLTLAGATLGLVWVPGPPVEAVIALSILFLAGEMLKVVRGKPSLTARSPWLVAFTFGLLHGFGFAGALADVGLPPHEIPLALLMFNVGVELGQLVFVLGVLGVTMVLKKAVRYWPTWMEQLPAYCIGSISAFWLIERVSGF
ncbi:HupE/UreJ family protein (plasmid) [Aliisedimentitalea scapharcae]|uniref:HupE/UreJ family protein n=1 Tax=Aliisedimentitalea scapharcae TaxID=1524259 RepID=A0ABZ2Y2P0_9RHOB